MKNIIKNFFQKFKNLLNFNRKLNEEELILRGKILIETIKNKTPIEINDIEFKIFSQFGDDGIIQYLIYKLQIEEKNYNFIEFGVENYLESNTRYLLLNNNWSGLILDSSEKNINQIKNSGFFWKYDLEAKSCFINRSNINNILLESKIDKNNIGILSIDIDGNDFWVWKEITVIDPLIVIVEFNSVFGFHEKISVPYDENFYRTKAHHSNLFWGASLEAFKFLAAQKGYEFFSTNSAGNNAYFIKKDLYKKINFKLKRNVYQSKFRESRDNKGNKTFIRYNERLKIINDMVVENVETNKLSKLADLNLE